MRLPILIQTLCLSSFIYAQKIEVEGGAKFQTTNDNTKDSVLVTDGNGIIFYRDLSTMGDGDADPMNEIELPPGGQPNQVLSIGGIGNYMWKEDENTIQMISRDGLTVTLSDGGGSFQDSVNVYTGGDGINIVGKEVSRSPGTTPGEMQYWNGTAWVTVAPGKAGQFLRFFNGVPTWTPEVGSTDVLNPATGKVWMDRNLGATQVATSSTDAASYGDLYQWGRGTDGHQIRTSGTTSTLSSVDSPGHGDFISISSSPFNWRSPQNDTLWQGVSGINNPCPTGYRLPTNEEWEAERLSWSGPTAAGAFGSPLKLPAAGARRYDGFLEQEGSYGYYWSSSTFDFSGVVTGGTINFQSNSVGLGYNLTANGFSVRCIKD